MKQWTSAVSCALVLAAFSSVADEGSQAGVIGTAFGISPAAQQSDPGASPSTAADTHKNGNGGGQSGGGNHGALGATTAARLLTQATFGPTLDTVAATQKQSYDDWFAAQASLSPSLTLPNVPNKDTNWRPFWWRNVVTGRDQLRQRMAFALSEILVVSDQAAAIADQNQALAGYYDLLVTNALGNYRALLEKVTLSPAMGLYLNLFRSDRANGNTGVHADQNYARELMQLFTIGLVGLNADGSPRTDSHGAPIPTYDQTDVENLANTLTGWASHPTQHGGEQAWQYDVDYVQPMVAYENHHDTSAKTLVGDVRVAAGGSAGADLKIALDTLFRHPNVGPFLAMQLIQRLVTSNPSPAYVKRVASAFNDNGRGVRGDLLAVAKAIFTDREAVAPAGTTGGKLREPLLRLAHLWRAFQAADGSGRVGEYLIVQDAGTLFAQSPLSAVTVFNFFQPDYTRTGQLARAGLVAPEFEITNENTLVTSSNRFQRQAYQFVDGDGRRHAGQHGYDESGSLDQTSVLLRTGPWESYAKKPEQLVDQLDLVLMAGTMTKAMRSTLVDYVSAVPASERANRVIETADLILNSPQYAVQR